MQASTWFSYGGHVHPMKDGSNFSLRDPNSQGQTCVAMFYYFWRVGSWVILIFKKLIIFILFSFSEFVLFWYFKNKIKYFSKNVRVQDMDKEMVCWIRAESWNWEWGGINNLRPDCQLIWLWRCRSHSWWWCAMGKRESWDSGASIFNRWAKVGAGRGNHKGPWVI